MNFLIIDGNSIINRAFFGIRILTAKDGHFTNAIYGFMNILLSLTDYCSPDAVAVAFDVKQPTFRHQMYSGYKAGRKPMPPELFEQMEPLKKLLSAYGAHIIECPGYEADDILGTLSSHCPIGSHCYIATGDRDSLQLVRDNVSVLLTTTKMGKTQTTEYDPQKLMEEYGVSPEGMIELKALQGDSSDNIPGVAGVGPKTAGELIRKYGNIDRIYNEIDTLDIKETLKVKLLKDKENAFFSRKLGTICLEAPIETDIKKYTLNSIDKPLLKKELAYHEMFKMIKRLDLDSLTDTQTEQTPEDRLSVRPELRIADEAFFERLLSEKKPVYFEALFKEKVPETIFIYNDFNVYVADGLSLYSESIFLRILADEEIPKYVYDSKPVFGYCFGKNAKLRNVVFDVRLAAYLLDPDASDYLLSDLLLKYSVNVTEPDAAPGCEELTEKYAGQVKAFAGFGLLCGKISAAIEENEQSELLNNIEIPLAEVLASMEMYGIRIDRNDILSYSSVLAEKTDELKKKVWAAAGEEFNINSPKQLGVILFEKLGLPCKKKTKTGYSTSADVLEELAEDFPVVADILEYRTYSKLRSTYCDGLLHAVDDDGRVRCTFNQTETRTGRLSSTEPNLQNIPVRTAVGREFRKFFTADDTCVIVDADYSQIELRVLASLSDDTNMINAFNEGTDIHSVTASKVFGLPVEEVTGELRSKAKAVNFGIVYGIGAFSLAKNIKSSRKEAESFINSYLALYSSVKKYMENAVLSAKEKGFAETLFHRKRYLPELTSSNHMIRAFGERVAMNMPIQGTAADIIKLAMIRVYRRLEKEHPDAHLIMQVHDELMIETPENKADEICQLISEEMENAVSLSVKLSVEAHSGKTWYEAKS